MRSKLRDVVFEFDLLIHFSGGTSMPAMAKRLERFSGDSA